MSSEPDADDPLDACHATEIAITHKDWTVAEKAALETLARIRKQKRREALA